MSEKTGGLERVEVPKIRHRIAITVRLDWESVMKFDNVAIYERKKRAELARDMLLEKLQVYDRNPVYKRFLKQLEQKREKSNDPA
jgi:hypothetical protein